MKLRDAIRYFELTGNDIFSDLKKQSEYINYLSFDFDLPNDFSEVIEKVGDNLLILWADGCEISEDTEMPTTDQLIAMYLNGIPNQKIKEESDEFGIVEAPSRFKKSKDDNKTLELIVSIVNSEMNLSQFYDLETELVIEIVNKVAEKREAEEKKRKNRKRGK